MPAHQLLVHPAADHLDGEHALLVLAFVAFHVFACCLLHACCLSGWPESDAGNVGVHVLLMSVPQHPDVHSLVLVRATGARALHALVKSVVLFTCARVRVDAHVCSFCMRVRAHVCDGLTICERSAHASACSCCTCVQAQSCVQVRARECVYVPATMFVRARAFVYVRTLARGVVIVIFAVQRVHACDAQELQLMHVYEGDVLISCAHWCLHVRA